MLQAEQALDARDVSSGDRRQPVETTRLGARLVLEVVAPVGPLPEQLAAAITRKVPDFKIGYKPDSRQAIADTWPQSLDDATATADWGWKARIGVDEMVADMLANVDVHLGKAA